MWGGGCPGDGCLVQVVGVLMVGFQVVGVPVVGVQVVQEWSEQWEVGDDVVVECIGGVE